MRFGLDRFNQEQQHDQLPDRHAGKYSHRPVERCHMQIGHNNRASPENSTERDKDNRI
jgi:hypothetical protein